MVDDSNITKYFAAYYFVTSTITTVGYGDLHATSTLERILAIIFMICGVIAFSYATGTLTSILTNVDKAGAIRREKLQMVNNMKNKFGLTDKIIKKLKECAVFQATRDCEDYTEFLDSLAPRLKMTVSL